MGGALNEAGAAVEELVGLPLQRDAAMRAAVAIGEYLAVAASRHQPKPGDFKPAALCLRQCAAAAEQYHSDLRA